MHEQQRDHDQRGECEYLEDLTLIVVSPPDEDRLASRVDADPRGFEFFS